MSGIGRNERCPCGSGKKHKHCCALNPGAASSPGLALARRYHDTGNRLFDEVFAWANRKFRKRLSEPLRERFGDAFGEEELGALYIPWLILHHPIAGKSPLQHFVAERGGTLTEAERASAAATEASWLGVWEVVRIERGEGIEMREAFSHEVRFVHDANASRTTEPRLNVLGYVVDHPGVSVLDGMHPNALTPAEAEPLILEGRRRLGVRTRAAAAWAVRDPDHALSLLGDWTIALAEREARSRQPRVLHNTDGDPVLWTTDHFDVPAAARDETEQRLREFAPLSPPEPEGGALRFTWTRPGNPMHGSWTNTLLGNVELRGTRLTIESNSVARADRLRSEMEACLGSCARHRLREHRDVNAMLAEAAARPGAASAPAPTPPEVREIIRRELERYYEHWLDDPVPALDGLSPREAMLKPASRRKLVTLLKELEHHESRKRDDERFEVARLWSALGLDPASGERIKPGRPAPGARARK